MGSIARTLARCNATRASEKLPSSKLSDRSFQGPFVLNPHVVIIGICEELISTQQYGVQIITDPTFPDEATCKRVV